MKTESRGNDTGSKLCSVSLTLNKSKKVAEHDYKRYVKLALDKCRTII